MKKFIVEIFDTTSKNNVFVLNAEGKKELKRLESIYLPTMPLSRKNKYVFYSEIEKLESLLKKDEDEKTKKQAQIVNKVKKVPFIDYLASHPTIEWLNLNYKVIEDIEKVLWSYLDEIETAKDRIIADIVEKELAMRREENNSLKYAA